MTRPLVDGAIAASTAEDPPEVRIAFRPRECSIGWAKRCAASKGRRCKCACGGAHHGTLRAQLDLFAEVEIVSAAFAALADAARRP
jgi:hypothetical protein